MAEVPALGTNSVISQEGPTRSIGLETQPIMWENVPLMLLMEHLKELGNLAADLFKVQVEQSEQLDRILDLLEECSTDEDDEDSDEEDELAAVRSAGQGKRGRGASVAKGTPSPKVASRASSRGRCTPVGQGS